jgi:hypothetical protein
MHQMPRIVPAGRSHTSRASHPKDIETLDADSLPLEEGLRAMRLIKIIRVWILLFFAGIGIFDVTSEVANRWLGGGLLLSILLGMLVFAVLTVPLQRPKQQVS